MHARISPLQPSRRPCQCWREPELIPVPSQVPSSISEGIVMQLLPFVGKAAPFHFVERGRQGRNRSDPQNRPEEMGPQVFPTNKKRRKISETR